MKAKSCSNPNCDYVGTLFKSSPPLCKNCAMKYNYQNKEKVSENGLNKVREVKKYVIPKVSEKQKKISTAYTILKEQFLNGKPYCGIRFNNCTKIATDIHHKGIGSNKRKYYNDTTTWIQTCRNCHDVTHDLSAEEQYTLGLRIRT